MLERWNQSQDLIGIDLDMIDDVIWIFVIYLLIKSFKNEKCVQYYGVECTIITVHNSTIIGETPSA